MWKLKNTLDEINGILDIAGKKIPNLMTAIQIIQNETHQEKTIILKN